MRDAWRVSTWLNVRLKGSQAKLPPESEKMNAFQATRWMKWVLEEGPRGRALVLEIAEALSGRNHSHRDEINEALNVVKRGLIDGRLHAYAQSHVGGGKGPTPVEPPQPKPPEKKETKTFIEIELVTDEEKPKPVAFKKYKIQLPDSTTREGMLDANGKARVDGIDPGTCKVSFPDFDGPDWKAA
ncbi:MAG: hypothetical protein IPK82_37855 [Polyangiaceae bacterium]|nr:hypothetical protein [Polyangiaceae bacterium]